MITDDQYLLASIRYVLNNPVRAVGAVNDPVHWRWSSMKPTIGLQTPPRCLDVDSILGYFGSSTVSARRRFADFVRAGVASPRPVPGTEPGFTRRG